MNWRIWILAFLFGIGETSHFGWNLAPRSDAEVICDGITLILFAMAFLSTSRASGGSPTSSKKEE